MNIKDVLEKVKIRESIFSEFNKESIDKIFENYPDLKRKKNNLRWVIKEEKIKNKKNKVFYIIDTVNDKYYGFLIDSRTKDIEPTIATSGVLFDFSVIK